MQQLLNLKLLATDFCLLWMHEDTLVAARKLETLVHLGIVHFGFLTYPKIRELLGSARHPGRKVTILGK